MRGERRLWRAFKRKIKSLTSTPPPNLHFTFLFPVRPTACPQSPNNELPSAHCTPSLASPRPFPQRPKDRPNAPYAGLPCAPARVSSTPQNGTPESKAGRKRQTSISPRYPKQETDQIPRNRDPQKSDNSHSRPRASERAFTIPRSLSSVLSALLHRKYPIEWREL